MASPYASTTKVYEINLSTGRRRLMNTIGIGSRFQSMPWTSRHGVRMDLPENQLRAAREIVQGWKTNAPDPNKSYVIVQDGKEVK